MTARRTHEEFLAGMEAKNASVRVIGTYSRANDPVLVECRRCGYRWMGRPANLLGSKNKAPSGCPRCAHNLKGNTDDFIDEMRELNPTISVLGEYRGNKVPISVKCKVCGTIWNPTPNSLRSGHGCPTCFHVRRGRQAKKSEQEFVNQLHNVNSDIELIGHYEDANHKVQVKCSVCGNVWEAIPGNLLNGSGCPTCSRSSTSFMEQVIAEAFKDVLGDDKVLWRDSSAIEMELDVYIPDLHFAIEPGSWRAWHRDKVDRDRLKREKCCQAGIRLVTVYDNCPDSECPFEENCYSFPLDLASQKGHRDLRSLVINLLNDAGIDASLTDEEWEKIEALAHAQSRRRTHEQFIEQLRNRNPEIEVLGDYLGGRSPVLVRDKRCGHEFTQVPSALLRGQGCPKCRYVRAAQSNSLSNDVFLERVESLGIQIRPLEKCTGANKPIKVKCLVCGYEWAPTPHNLFSGHGCPRCAGCERKDPDGFREEIVRTHPSIEVIGEYKNSKTPITCYCKECGTTWDALPASLRRGSGCPVCSRRKRAEKQRLTHDEYASRLAKKNPNLELITRYESLDKYITARCIKCGDEFRVNAGNLLHRAFKKHLH